VFPHINSFVPNRSIPVLSPYICRKSYKNKKIKNKNISTIIVNMKTKK